MAQNDSVTGPRKHEIIDERKQMHMQTDRSEINTKGAHAYFENERAVLQKETIMNEVKFAITESGQVYGLRNHERPWLLGHIACVLRDDTVIGREIRIWWRHRLESDEAGENIVVTGSGQFYFVPCERRIGNDDLTHDQEPEEALVAGPSESPDLEKPRLPSGLFPGQDQIECGRTLYTVRARLGAIRLWATGPHEVIKERKAMEMQTDRSEQSVAILEKEKE
jgi:hypothetical protein